MKHNYIDTYRGAEIHEVVHGGEFNGKKVNIQLVAKGTLPGQNNLNVDFVQKGRNMETAMNKIRFAIDEYLSEHNLESFTGKKKTGRVGGN